MSLVFIGAINQNNFPQGGEEYKNQLIIKKINESIDDVKIIDTHRWLKKPFVWLDLIKTILLIKTDSVLISASSVSTYRLLKLINLVRPKLMQKTTYLVIGGYLPEGIRTKRFKWNVYEKLKNVVLEGDLLRKSINNNSRLSNIRVISNFKTFPDFKLSIIKKLSSTFRFVFVGRISEGKGIKEILEAAEILKLSEYYFEIHFFGPVEEYFFLESNNTKYCGFLDFQNNSVEAYLKLSEYNCMLFPTYWKGEGFPGVIIDALVSGLPVIATDWNMNSEIIEEGKNGYLIEPKNAEALAEKMMYVINNRENLEQIRINNLARAKDYHIDTVWPKLLKLL